MAGSLARASYDAYEAFNLRHREVDEAGHVSIPYNPATRLYKQPLRRNVRPHVMILEGGRKIPRFCQTSSLPDIIALFTSPTIGEMAYAIAAYMLAGQTPRVVPNLTTGTTNTPMAANRSSGDGSNDDGGDDTPPSPPPACKEKPRTGPEIGGAGGGSGGCGPGVNVGAAGGSGDADGVGGGSSGG
jgi:hypothetical protein